MLEDLIICMIAFGLFSLPIGIVGLVCKRNSLLLGIEILDVNGELVANGNDLGRIVETDKF